MGSFLAQTFVASLNCPWTIHCIHVIIVYFILSQATKHIVKDSSGKRIVKLIQCFHFHSFYEIGIS